MKKLNYRPEIDGLRSLAVISVIIYHAKININGINIIPGGFIGVDIFFVISGYLITSILLTSMKGNNFSFKKFYERRIRRIIPVLFFIIAFSTPFAWLYLLPSKFIEFANSSLSSVFFISNIYFWFVGEQYSAQSALLKPLLHTWSLAVEEQYYIIFPIILFVIFKYIKKYIFIFFLLIFFVSLFYADLGSKTFPSLNFYSLHSRGWELILGSLLSKLEIDNFRTGNDFFSKLNIMPTIGIMMILVSFIYFNDNIFHPSFLTLIPVTGVAILIWFCKKNEFITKILSNKILVGIGLISYSLYLWHYPIFAFARIDEFIQGSNANKIFLIFLTFVASIITFFLIEKPFRNRNKTNVKKLLIFISTLLILIITSSILIITNNGYLKRTPKILHEQFIDGLQKKVSQENKDCFDRRNQFCIFNKDSRDSIILVGDSHLEVLHRPLLDFSNNNSFKITLMTNSGCPYLPGFNRINKKTGLIQSCSNKLQTKRKEIILKSDSIVIVGGRYPLALSEEFFDNEEGGKEFGEWDDYFEPTNQKTISKIQRQKLLALSFKKNINEILENGNKVLLIYPIPMPGWDLPPKFINELPKKDGNIEKKLREKPITTSYEVYKKRARKTFKMFDSISNQNLIRIYPHKLFCDNKIKNRCTNHSLKKIFYRDSSHLSHEGSKMLMNLISDKIR